MNNFAQLQLVKIVVFPAASRPSIKCEQAVVVLSVFTEERPHTSLKPFGREEE
jgi:hypothetical protein